MRFLVVLCISALVLAARAAAAVPPELAAALQHFRPDPPRGWSYTQTTRAEGKSTVEHYDAAKLEPERWSLVRVDDRAPTAEETRDYAEKRSRWSRGGQAPRITDQLDTETIERIAETAEHVTFRSRLRRGEAGDKTADFLRATLVVDKATQSLARIELASVGEFSPTLGVKIAEMKTVMTYTLPAGDTPARPQAVETRVRGRAFWVKSLDADMTVTYSDYQRAQK
jgi:hypothetical protein